MVTGSRTTTDGASLRDEAPTGSTLDRFESTLAKVVRLLADRTTVGDIAARSGHLLPAASWALLEYLAEHGTMPVSAIAACHGVDVSSVTPRLKTLESAGLIARHRDPDDARVHHISITAPGQHALSCVHAARRDFLAEAAGNLESEALDATTTVLEHLVAQLSPTNRRLDGMT
jgi:DNA-binding MarR family transcriptional regulator